MFQGYERKEWFVMLANLKVRTKLVLLTAVAAVSMCVMGIMNMAGMEKSYKHSVSSMKCCMRIMMGKSKGRWKM